MLQDLFGFSPGLRCRGRALVIAACFVSLALAGGTYVQIISTNRVSDSTTNYRWEPSSSVGSSWVTSWNDINLPQSAYPGYTSSWNGGWGAPFLHRLNSHDTGDLFLTFNAVQSKHNLVMLDLTNCNLGFRTSTDAAGGNWNTPVVATSLGDYPSLAVAGNGRLVAGFNTTDTDCRYVYGFKTVVSTNGGGSWSGPYTVRSAPTETFGRVVASGNTFHYIFVDTSAAPTYVLRRSQSSDGINWTLSPTPLDTYTAPRRFSPGQYCAGSNCGRIHYATWIDAAAAPGLGWVVFYSVARSDNPDVNNLKFCAEHLAGCTTITYSTDLFAHGITTSSTGDLWLSMLSYTGAPNRTLPLLMIAIYRKPNGTYLNGTVNSNIVPTAWRFTTSSNPVSSRCGGNNCFSAGDDFRPTMNVYTGASLPFVQQSARQTDLMQVFVQDPQVGVPPVPGLEIGPLQPFGTDSTFKGVLPLEEQQERQPDLTASVRFLVGR